MYPQFMFLWRNKKNIYLRRPVICSYNVCLLLPDITDFIGIHLSNTIFRIEMRKVSDT